MKRVLGIAVCLYLWVGAAHAADYLDAELRSQVESLKASHREGITSQENGRARALVLWKWINRYALTGRTIPVNTTQYINSLLAVDDEDRISPGLLKAMDDLIREFSVLDEQPGAIGTISISNRGPFQIDSWQTVEVTYTVGEMAIADGGVVLVSRHFRDDGTAWQHSDPSGDGYISIRSSSDAVTFEPTTVPVRGMHGGFRGPQPQLAFRVTGGLLTPGDTFTVVYGDTSGGGRGFQVQSYSIDAAPLPLYVDFNREDVFFTLPTATYAVRGKEPYAVHGFGPAIVGTGELFDLSVRFEDEYYNRATAPMPRVLVELDGEPYLTLAAGGAAIQVLRKVRIDEPGVHRFTIASTDGRIRGTSDPIWVQDEPSMRVYWGETHGHCGFAEGQGSANSFFAFGRDDARLDFLTLSEHDIWMDDYEWQQLNQLSARYNEPGRFVTFPGYEWTARRNRGGHHNVFFRRTGWDRVPGQEAPRLTDLYLGLHAKYAPEDVLIIPHAHQAGDWRSNDVYLERLVEIMSMHGTFEWFGDRYLKYGHEVGFISASDDHLSHPGYSTGTRNGIGQRGGLAAVYAPELTNNAVFDALRNRQTYATSGERMILDAALNGFAMGTRQPFVEERVMNGQVMGTAPIACVSLVKNGETIEEIDYDAASLTPHVFVQVGFESPSDVPVRDNPRGYRPWRGSLTVSGAEVVGVTPRGFHGRRTESVSVDKDDPQSIRFVTATRGRMNNFLLELTGASEDTHIAFTLDDAREYGTAPVQVRRPARLPGATGVFSFADLEDGAATYSFDVDRYRDEMSVKLVDPAIPLDRTFEFRDSESSQPGDYYYVRVRQTDGALAWSSPFWVGGERRR